MSERAPRLVLAAVLLAFVADRVALAMRRGERPFWRLDGQAEAEADRAARALIAEGWPRAGLLPRCGLEANADSPSPAIRASEVCTRLQAGPVLVLALSYSILGLHPHAFKWTRLAALGGFAAGGLALLLTLERRVWANSAWATAAAAILLYWPPASRDAALSLGGAAYSGMAVFAGLALGAVAESGRRYRLAGLGLGALAGVFAPMSPLVVAAAPAVGSLLSRRKGPSRDLLLVSASVGLAWTAAWVVHGLQVAAAFGWQAAVADQRAASALLADVARLGEVTPWTSAVQEGFWIGPAGMLLLALWCAWVHPEHDRRALLATAAVIASTAAWGAMLLFPGRSDVAPHSAARAFLLAQACWLAAAGSAGAALRQVASSGGASVRGQLTAPRLRLPWLTVLWAVILHGIGFGLALDPSSRLARGAVFASCLLGLGAMLPLLVRLEGRERLRNAGLACASALGVLLVLEIGFSQVPRSHGVGYTLAARLWAPNLRPLNAYGYRDAEYTPQRAARPHKLVVVGDSFAEGGGVSDVRDRFANVLASLLPSDHEVFVLAQGGVDTADEYRFLERFPWTPQTIVLSYYANDIEGRAQEHGLSLPAFTPYADVPALAVHLVRRSYLLNYAYWLFPHQDTDAYRRFLVQAYSDEAILAAHLADLDRFPAFAREHQARLVVVLFPFMNDVAGSRFFLDRIQEHLEGQGVPVLNVASLVQGLPVRSLVVNSQDPHAGVAVHHLVGRKLYELLVAHQAVGARRDGG